MTIIELLKGINEASRQRLKLIVLGRETEIPENFVESLQSLYQADFHDVVLMPLDHENARRFVGEQNFDAVLSVIRDRRLEGVCNIPAALQYIAEHQDSSDLSEESVWKGILENLMREKSARRGDAD